MRYTLWLDGHLLGETRLEHRNPVSRQRLGGLTPTPYGLEMLPGLCGFLTAATAVKACMERLGVRDPESDVDHTTRVLETTPEGRQFTRVVSALSRLELREAGGERAAFHTLIVTDLRELEQLSAALAAAPEHERRGPRFLVSATPVDITAVSSHLRSRGAMRIRLEPN